jgi:hypothetical protein
LYLTDDPKEAAKIIEQAWKNYLRDARQHVKNVKAHSLW